MHFDPNTGEKIMDPGDEIQNTAAQAVTPEQAAQNVQDAAQQAQAAAQAAQQAAQQAAAPAADAAQQAQQAYAQAQQPQFQAQQPQFQAQQPQFQAAPAVPQGEKVKKGLPIGAVIGIVAAVLVVLGVVAFFCLRNLGGKVTLVNTLINAYDGEYLTEASKDFKIDPFGEFGYTVEGEIEDIEFNVAVASNGGSHTRSAYASVTYSGFTADFTGYIDEKNIKASCPVLGDYLFLYDYSNNDNDGFLIEMLEDNGVDVEDFNAVIGFMNDNSDLVKKFYDKNVDYFMGIANDLNFKKTGEKETFTVNGKSVTCKEYQAVITEDLVVEWIEGYQELWDDFYEENSDDFEIIEDLAGIDFDLEDMFDEMIDACDDMEDTTVSIFSKGTTAACIRIEEDDNMIEILFKGGDYLAQNVEINYDFDGDDGTLLTIEGKTKGDVQTTTIEAEEADYELEYSYNRKTGEFTMTSEMYGREMYNIECTLEISKNEIKYTYETMEIYGEEIPFDSLVITYTNKAEIKEPKKGEEIDLGNMDEDEMQDLVMDIMEEIEDNDDLQDVMEDFEDLMWYFY
ncbi:MAG: hypothetical protein K6F65_06160 [Lachnospiraceae bacterium]|nr:hypothetical protein [Lachnospiraceae bacterium]